MGSGGQFVAAAEGDGRHLRIIGNDKTRQSMEIPDSSLPRPTDVVEWPRGSFEFEGITVELHGFEWAAHCDDHAAWLLTEDRVIHSSDLINPDQPPFWHFAGNERFRHHEDNLRQIYDLGWDHLSGSHGNLGTREDIDFEFAFLADVKAAIGDAMAAHPFSDFVDPEIDAHTSFLHYFFDTISHRGHRRAASQVVGDAVAFDDADEGLAALHERVGRDVEDGVGS
jgi:hypothetical protein